MRSSDELQVDPIACTGHGVCASLLPDTVTRDEWGYPILKPGLRDARQIQDAITLCPARALYLTRRVD